MTTSHIITIFLFIAGGLFGIIHYFFSQSQKLRKENAELKIDLSEKDAESKIKLSEKDITHLIEKIDEMKTDMIKGFENIDKALSKYITKEQVNNLINTKTNLFKEILSKDVKNIIKQARGMKIQIRTTFASSMILVGCLVNSLARGDTKVSMEVIKTFNDVLKDNDIKIAKLENGDDIDNLVKKIIPD